MSSRYSGFPSRALLAVMVSAAIGSVSAQDSGLGIDLHFGNDLNPNGNFGIGCDPRGSSYVITERKRTPTGFLYNCIPELAPYKQAANGWEYNGSFGLGYLYLGGDEMATMWSRFNNFDDGMLVNADLSLRRTSDGRYLNFTGNRVNSDSQYYRMTAGQAGRYRFQAFSRSQSNVLSDRVKSLWGNLGSQNLTLKPGLTPGGMTRAQVDAFMDGEPMTRVTVTRDKYGAGINYYLNREWTAFFNASHERREGTRPFGGPFSFGRLIETQRPIDDSTTNVNAGLRFVGSDWRMEFTYTGSFFRNGMSHFTYESTHIIANNNNPVGLFSYEPENDYHRIGATFTRKIRGNWNGEFSLGFAGTRMRQNDDLVPGLRCTGMLNATVSCDDWNTPAALSRRTADVGIDNQRVTGRLVLQPSSTVTWNSTFSFLREDYDGTYLAFNPLTGELGYMAENGALPNNRWLPGASNNIHVKNLPLDKETLDFSTGLTWRLGMKNTISASYGHTRIERTNREFLKSEDDTVKLTWINRANDWMTVRLNYVYLDRDGSDFNFDPYEFMYTHDQPGFVMPPNLRPHTTSDMRKFDVGEREQQKIDLMLTFALPKQMTLYTSVRAEDNDYNASIGRYGYDTTAASIQWEWQPRAETTVSAWYGYDRSKLRVVNVNDVNSGNNNSEVGGGGDYTLDRLWWMDDKQRNHNGGFNLRHRLGRAVLDLDWSYINAQGITSWNAASTLSGVVLADALLGQFPDMRYRSNSLTASVLVPFGERVAMRMFGTWERGHMFDWHYDGFDTSRTAGNMIYTDGGPLGSYNAHLIGMMLEVKL